MKSIINIKMKAIHGALEYSKGSKSYLIPIEHTGDYKRGLLVFFKDISPTIPDSDKRELLSEIRRGLQIWAKENQEPLCW